MSFAFGGEWLRFLLALSGLVIGLLTFLVIRVFVVFYFLQPSESRKRVEKSCLYVGRVKHTRFHEKKHMLNYPLFLSCIDLDEADKIGWLLWPIFKVNAGSLAFCSLNSVDHLKGDLSAPGATLYENACAFVFNSTGGALSACDSGRSIKLLSHLNYFGYCFNPISIFYVLGGKRREEIEGVVAEVSNTPWGEMHPYMLHESVSSVQVTRPKPSSSSSAARSKSRGRSRSRGRSGGEAEQQLFFTASWPKAFHVSPFMEMHYQYTFAFGAPGKTVAVQSQMHNSNTGKLAFTASFDMVRMDMTPMSLLFVLLWYPLHTRLIQLWIHVEAAKLWWKGVTFFPHPLGHDVDLGLGISAGGIAALLVPPISGLLSLWAWLLPLPSTIDSKKKRATKQRER